MPLQFRLPQGLAAKGLMRPTLVIKADPLADADARLETVAAGLQVNLLIRQAAPQPFDEDIVRPAPAAVHADPHAGSSKLVGEGGAGELHSLAVLKISGRPLRSASSTVPRQNEVSMVSDKCHARTQRLYQSVTTTRSDSPGHRDVGDSPHLVGRWIVISRGGREIRRCHLGGYWRPRTK